MTPEEREALLRRAGVRPAWQGTREARPGYQQQQSPAGALADPRTVPYRRIPTRRDREFSRASLADTTLRGAYSEPRNQIAEAGMSALETTGAPSFARGVRSLQANEPGRAAGEFSMGALGLLGTASLPFGGGARAAPTRIPRISQAIPEALPTAPPRLPGRVTEQAVRPVMAPDGGAAGEGRYRPLDENGNPVASEAYPFGFRRLGPNSYRTDQFFDRDPTFDWPDEGVDLRGMRRSRDTVNISDLSSTQIRVGEAFLNPDRPRNPRMLDGSRSPFTDRPAVVRIGDDLFVVDGHNRIAEAAARGETTVDVTVLDGSRALRQQRRAPDAPNAGPPRSPPMFPGAQR